MASSYKDDQANCIRLMREQVMPSVEAQWPAVKLYLTEGMDGHMRADRDLGIDNWISLDRGHSYQSLANRCQEDGKMWCTFTVRSYRLDTEAPTELHKRIDPSTPNPDWVLQSYHHAENGLLVGALVNGSKFYQFLTNTHDDRTIWQKSQCGFQEFIFCDWYTLSQNGLKINVFGPNASEVQL